MHHRHTDPDDGSRTKGGHGRQTDGINTRPKMTYA